MAYVRQGEVWVQDKIVSLQTKSLAVKMCYVLFWFGSFSWV